jgi:hypothetical protein
MIERTMRSFLRAVAVLVLAAGGLGCGGDAVCPSFVHIVGGEFARTGNMLSWTLQLEELPAELTFNQAAVPSFFLEYRWAVDLDSDLDGSVDLRVALEHFAESGAAPVTTAILSGTSKDLLEVQGAVASTVGTFTATVDTNTFTFETPATAAPGLANVSARGQSTWTTSYRWGADPDDQCDEQLR